MCNQYTAKDIARFWGKVDKESSEVFYNSSRCWQWCSSCFSNGYGGFYFDGQARLAHRISFELTFGKIPDGLNILHHCDNPSCVNPNHLFLGTHQENMTDKIRKCRQGDTRPKNPARGEKNGMAKLTDDQVSEIRRRYGFRGVGGDSSITLAKEFGVSATQIWEIVNYTARR